MEELEHDLVETIALNIVRTGSDRINFKILKMAETGTEKYSGIKIEDVVKETGLTKVPVNVRVNELERLGLVQRWRGTGLVMLTDLGKIFIGAVNRGEDMVRERIMEMLNSISDHN